MLFPRRDKRQADGGDGIDGERRRLLLASAALGLTACAGGCASPPRRTSPTIDLHSHAGRVIPARPPGFDRPFTPLATPMREGGMDVVCLAVVADTPVTRVEQGRVVAWREPEPGELYAWSLEAYARAAALIERERLAVVVDRASMAAAIDAPSVVIASEGADFLDERLDRVDEFYERWSLRHLQLTHYRVNTLGDIQTVPPVHGGLTAFGRSVVRRCNQRGIVVDVAHAPFETVRGVVDVTSRPLVLSHTSLSARPAPLSRLISPDHARLVASTGGVLGIWPPASRFPSMTALAGGIRDMVEVVGVDHVGLGSDMLGLTGPSIFPSYAELPALARALHAIGFDDSEVERITGANYARVFDACMRT